jgi:hypothetical protein
MLLNPSFFYFSCAHAPLKHALHVCRPFFVISHFNARNKQCANIKQAAMKNLLTFMLLTIYASLFGQSGQGHYGFRGLTGNTIIQFVPGKSDKKFFTDPIDDTIHFKHVVDKFYQDTVGKIYLLTSAFDTWNDTSVTYEYFRNYSDFISIKTYQALKNGYFINKEKVYIWWGNSDGEMPIEIKGADAKTFVPFDSIEGGVDKNFVYYGGPPDDFKVIEGANPRTIKVLNPTRGCGNCGNCYFVDDKHVFFAFKKIDSADAKTFKLLNQEKVDAEDKNGKYFDGQLIK